MGPNYRVQVPLRGTQFRWWHQHRHQQRDRQSVETGPPPPPGAVTAGTCPALFLRGVFCWRPRRGFSFCVAASRTHGNPYRRYPGRFEHSVDYRFPVYSSCIESNACKRPARQSGWRGPQFCYYTNCSCRCSCCKSRRHLPAVTGAHPSREGCRMCCNGNSRYATYCRLSGVSK